MGFRQKFRDTAMKEFHMEKVLPSCFQAVILFAAKNFDEFAT